MISTPPVRIAMWSGPRNLSTTMMRSFGARADTHCIDEPFYAAYLAATGLDHPMADAILAAQEADPATVDLALATACPGPPVLYHKHMTHHMLDGFGDRIWTACRHAFLIRRPERVIASYARKMDALSLDAIGFPGQRAIFDRVCDAAGAVPPVIDTDDLLANPEEVLRALCARLGIGWDPAMLSWPAGPRPEDGPWAPHWYDAVWGSTGFGPPPGACPRPTGAAAAIAAAAQPLYDALAQHRIGCPDKGE